MYSIEITRVLNDRERSPYKGIEGADDGKEAKENLRALKRALEARRGK